MAGKERKREPLTHLWSRGPCDRHQPRPHGRQVRLVQHGVWLRRPDRSRARARKLDVPLPKSRLVDQQGDQPTAHTALASTSGWSMRWTSSDQALYLEQEIERFLKIRMRRWSGSCACQRQMSIGITHNSRPRSSASRNRNSVSGLFRHIDRLIPHPPNAAAPLCSGCQRPADTIHRSSRGCRRQRCCHRA